MSFTVNSVYLLGNMVRDVELKDASNGVSMATIILATNRNIKKADGTFEDKGTTHKVVAWDKVALFAQEALHVGDRVFIEGRVDTREIIDALGVKRLTTEIIARNIIPMTPPRLVQYR